jgi:putative addiction module component (TIGR02574 family)
MSLPTDLLSQALNLPEDDRRELLGHLALSLPEELGPDEFAAEWAGEIDRRLEAFHRGETQAISGDKAFADAREALERNRRK